MADEKKYRIPLFDGNNFSNWKFRMEVLLKEKDLLEFTQKPDNEIVEAAATQLTPAEQQQLENLIKMEMQVLNNIENRG